MTISNFWDNQNRNLENVRNPSKRSFSGKILLLQGLKSVNGNVLKISLSFCLCVYNIESILPSNISVESHNKNSLDVFELVKGNPCLLTYFMLLVFFYNSWKLWFSDVFRGYTKRPIAYNGLIGVIWMRKYVSNHFFPSTYGDVTIYGKKHQGDVTWQNGRQWFIVIEVPYKRQFQ